MPKKSESREGMPRRALLKSALMVLGASVIVQPSGAVFGLAQETPKKDDSKIKADSKTKNSHIKGEGTHIKADSKIKLTQSKVQSNHIKGESKANKTHKGTQIKTDSTTPPAKKTS